MQVPANRHNVLTGVLYFLLEGFRVVLPRGLPAGRLRVSVIIRKASCHFCPSRCGVLLYIAGGSLTRVEGDPEHPVTRGWTCSKGRVEIRKGYRQGKYRAGDG
jgi:anaerobic selenocysteine-containing dehydrogenase